MIYRQNRILKSQSIPYIRGVKVRNIIAHGTVDALSEAQRDLIAQRIWDAEKIARRYILAVLKKALHFEPTQSVIYAAIFMGVENMITKTEDMHHGPIHMAIIYG